MIVSELTAAADVVEALAGAWTIYNLYPDPESQPSFHRVGEALRLAAVEDIWLDVGPGFFVCGDEEVPMEREAAGRLAQRCFVHNISSIGITGRPTDRDLARLMGVLMLDEPELEQQGGLHALLMRDGVDSIAVVTRVPLATAEEDAEFERDELVQQVMNDGLDPEAFAAALVEEAGGDLDMLAELFHTKYRDVYQRVDDGDVAAREETVRAFVESFFFFDEPARIVVLEPFLVNHEDAADRVFLDQFAGHELARIAPRLDSNGFALLLDYARIASDQADRRPDELMALIGSEDGGRSAVEAVAARVQERLAVSTSSADTLDGEFASLRAQFPDQRRYFYDTLDTFRGLLRVEDRDDRFRRLMRVLTGKITANIRRGRYRHAELWIRSVVDAPTYAADRRVEVDEALRQAATPDILEMLIGELALPDGTPVASRLVEELGAFGVNGLIGLLQDEHDRARRKALIDVLGKVVAEDPRPVIDALDDERWYVVRNLAVVLRKAGNPDALTALRGLLEHEDHRVRVEALRALNAIAPSSTLDVVGGALDDDHERVRSAAIGLLASRMDEASESHLIEALDGSLRTEEKVDVIRHLGERNTDRVRTVLGAIAGKRFVITRRGRAIRSAAREALEGWA